MRRKYAQLPANDLRMDSMAHVGLIGCGNYGFSVIAHYLQKNYGNVIRGCMDIDVNRAASLFENFQASYYTTDAGRIIDDPKIRLVFIASNHASHAEYAIQALAAGKDVHIEKPHVVTDDQLQRLCAALRAHPSRIVSIGFNRPCSPFGNQVRESLWRDQGELMQSWFIAGHKIDRDHWYFNKGEGGRVLGNLCHWIDMVYQIMPPDRRFPVMINPTPSAKAEANMAVSYVFGDGSIASLTFCEQDEGFEGVRERYTANRGNTFVSIDDFKRLTIDVGADKWQWSPRHRDHGHEASICRSYETSADSGTVGCEERYVSEAGQLFLRTREALETSRALSVDAWPGADLLTPE
ncbi:MAG: Gfo/Idh/MocA family oxidoreductase [Caldilineaceae bacterium]|nr:Gfo/Idh/MocA family oxidoreductase [Caldilineaceae bacterium]